MQLPPNTVAPEETCMRTPKEFLNEKGMPCAFRQESKKDHICKMKLLSVDRALR